jgi:hypothetical protein
MGLSRPSFARRKSIPAGFFFFAVEIFEKETCGIEF